MYNTAELNQMRVAYNVILNSITNYALRASIAEGRVQTAILAKLQANDVIAECDNYCIGVCNLVYSGMKPLKTKESLAEWAAVNQWLKSRVEEYHYDDYYKPAPNEPEGIRVVMAISVAYTKNGQKALKRIDVARWKIQ